MWEAAKECEKGVPRLRVERIYQGTLWFRYDLPHDEAAFKDCYQQRVWEKLKSVPLVASGHVAKGAVGPEKTSVPIEVVAGAILVPVTLNEYNQATLLLDTGATFTVLRPVFVERLGIFVAKGARRETVEVFGGKTVSMPLVRVRSLKVGGLAVEDLEIGAYDALPEAQQVDGILGSNFLNHFRVTIDHGAQRLTLEVTRPTVGSTSSEYSGSQRARSWPLPQWVPGDEWRFRWESPIGKGTFVWTVTEEEVIDNVAYYVVKSGSRRVYYLKHNLGWHMDKVEGVVVSRASPPFAYDWPLEVGKSWELTYEWEDRSAQQTEQRYRKCTVAGEQTVMVPAGTFATLHIVCKNRAGRVTSEVWYSPEVKHWVKEKSLQSYGGRARELVSYQVR